MSIEPEPIHWAPPGSMPENFRRQFADAAIQYLDQHHIAYEPSEREGLSSLFSDMVGLSGPEGLALGLRLWTIVDEKAADKAHWPAYLTAVVAFDLTLKALDDDHPTLEQWAQALGCTLKDLRTLERLFLEQLDHYAMRPAEEVEAVLEELEAVVQPPAVIIYLPQRVRWAEVSGRIANPAAAAAAKRIAAQFRVDRNYLAWGLGGFAVVGVIALAMYFNWSTVRRWV
jgi:AraC-like DNA-binding protein